jgi:hypothetical protein
MTSYSSNQNKRNFFSCHVYHSILSFPFHSISYLVLYPITMVAPTLIILLGLISIQLNGIQISLELNLKLIEIQI